MNDLLDCYVAFVTAAVIIRCNGILLGSQLSGDILVLKI